MVSEGSSSLRKTPSVELIMPAPMRTTSGSSMKVSGIGFLFQICWLDSLLLASPGSGHRSLQLASAKRHQGSRLKDHVRAAPGRIVGQFPTVSRADGVLGEQDIAGVKKEMLTATRLEIQRST